MCLTKRWPYLPTVALVLFTVSPARAVMVTNVTTGTVLFFDDFEGLGTAVSHVPYSDNSGDFDPLAVIGTWSPDESAQTMIQVTDSTTAPDPGSWWGDNYLRMNSSINENIYIFGDLFEAQTVAEHDGDLIHWEMMVNISTTQTSPAIVGLFKDTGGQLVHILADTNGGIRSYSGGYASTGLTFTPGEWMRVELDYTIGANTFDLTVDGTTAANLGLYTPDSGGGVGMIRLGARPDGTYFDATLVPEPSAMALLFIGGLCLSIGSRRRRRG